MMQRSKSFLLWLVGQKNAGRLDYLFDRISKDAWGPLNGQRIRQDVYSEIVQKIQFQAIVETGTFLGTTTEYFAQSGLPVYTIEIDPRNYAYASLRFRGRRRQIHVYEGDSRGFLEKLANQADFPKSSVFFYLDAHVQGATQYTKPPVIEESEIIFANWSEAVVMIDDFEVPGTAYSYIDEGPGKQLNLEHLKPLGHLRLSSFFPVPGPSLETGAKRGWVVLCQDHSTNQILRGINNIAPALATPAFSDTRRGSAVLQ